jgi:hypothetical protein
MVDDERYRGPQTSMRDCSRVISFRQAPIAAKSPSRSTNVRIGKHEAHAGKRLERSKCEWFHIRVPISIGAAKRKSGHSVTLLDVLQTQRNAVSRDNFLAAPS